MNMHVASGDGSSNRHASRDKSVESGDESIEAGEITAIMLYFPTIFCHIWRRISLKLFIYHICGKHFSYSKLWAPKWREIW